MPRERSRLFSTMVMALLLCAVIQPARSPRGLLGLSVRSDHSGSGSAAAYSPADRHVGTLRRAFAQEPTEVPATSTTPPTDEPTPGTGDGPESTLHLPLVFRSAALDEIPPPPTAARGTAAATKPALPTASLTPRLTSTPADSPGTPPPITPTPLPTAPVPFECTNPLQNGDFEARGGVGWLEQTDPDKSLFVSEAARSGRLGARMGLWDGGEEVLLSEVRVPTYALRDLPPITLRWWMRIETDEPIDGHVGDRLLLVLVGDSEEAIEYMYTFDEETWPPEGAVVSDDGWVEVTIDLSPGFVAGDDFKAASIAFIAVPDFDERLTTFDLDDMQLEICPRPSK